MRTILSSMAFFLAALFATPVMAADAGGEIPPPWEGRYCNEARCIVITGLEEGPTGGLFFDFAVTTAPGEMVGKASAMVDGRWAGYDVLIFTLGDDDAAVTVSLEPEMTPDADRAWLGKCPGVYVRK